jgi:hypothetical protein
LDGKFIVLTSNTPKCSVIEWTLDGSLRQTTVLDGEERIELLTTKPKELTVESCTQVKDLRALKEDDQQAAGTQHGSGSQTAARPHFERYCSQSPIPGAPLYIEKPDYWWCTSGDTIFVWCKRKASSEPVAIRSTPADGIEGVSRAMAVDREKMESLCRQ